MLDRINKRKRVDEDDDDVIDGDEAVTMQDGKEAQCHQYLKDRCKFYQLASSGTKAVLQGVCEYITIYFSRASHVSIFARSHR